MRRVVALVPCAAIVAGTFLAIGAARAGDVPAGSPAMPAMQKKVDHPFVKAWLGDWVVASKGAFGDSKGKASLWLGIVETAVMHEYTSEVRGGYGGHGVYRISDDGKTMTSWWFDSHATEPMKLVGPLSETSVELNGTSANGPLTVTWRRVADGWDFAITSGGQPMMTEEYRRAPK